MTSPGSSEHSRIMVRSSRFDRARVLCVECLGDGEAVLVDVMAGDEAVFDGEVQRETRAVGASGRAGSLANFAEHHRIRAVDQNAFDGGADLFGHVVASDLTKMFAGCAAQVLVYRPRGGTSTIRA